MENSSNNCGGCPWQGFNFMNSLADNTVDQKVESELEKKYNPSNIAYDSKNSE